MALAVGYEILGWGGNQVVAMEELGKLCGCTLRSGASQTRGVRCEFCGGILEKRSLGNHEAEVGVQVLVKDPDYCLHLKVSHKKITMLAKLKQKARLKRWSWRVAAWAIVSSSSCWAISITCHSSPTDEATKCSSNCSWPWSGIRRGGSPILSPALYQDGEWVEDRATSECQFASYNAGLDLQANALTGRLFRPHFNHSPIPNAYALHSSDKCPPL